MTKDCRHKLAGGAGMRGSYHGYDGSCLPWSDEIVHHYRLSSAALRIAYCPVGEDSSGVGVQKVTVEPVVERTAVVRTCDLSPPLVVH